MTRLFNLESYVECCQYGYTFGQDPKILTPPQSSSAIPIAYKVFCQKYNYKPFLPIPSLLDQQPQLLKARELPLISQTETIGVNLEDSHTKSDLYIVREVNSLILRSLQAEYLYANVFHYWNSVYHQLPVGINKPIVIYDFSSFTPEQITPFTLENHHHCDYPIPIIDTRDIKAYEGLKLSAVKYEQIYDNICLELAIKILEKLNLDSHYKLDLSNYLKKINVYTLFQKFPGREDFSLILLIDNFYYNYTLSTQELSELTLKYLPINELRATIHQNMDFQYVCLGHYTALPKVRQYLNEQLESYALVASTDLSSQSFPEVWEQRQNSNFPLYGQHLDRITFFVKRSGQTTDISLPQRICYEGENEITVYGQYHDLNGILKEEFPLTTREVALPFNINGTDYLNDHGEPQDYSIENQFFNDSPSLDIKICFRLKPGLTPKLEVVDSKQNRKLKSQLTTSQTSSNVSYIPIEDIKAYRLKVSSRTIDALERSQTIDKLNSSLGDLSNKLTSACQKINTFLTQTKSKSIKLRKDMLNKGDLFQELKSLRNALDETKRLVSPAQKKETLSIYALDYQKFDNLINLKRVYLDLDLSHKTELFVDLKRQLEKDIKKFPKTSENRQVLRSQINLVHVIIQSIILILGKSYAIGFSESSQVLFDNSEDNSCHVNFDLYWQNLARLSSTISTQSQYIGFFFKKSNKTGSEFYKSKAYLWGYARVLRWYLNFEEACNFLDYEQHFECILIEMLSSDSKVGSSKEYLRDGLLTLIYLLSFREYDHEMVAVGSHVYNLAKRLCRNLEAVDITTSQLDIDGHLSGYLETLLDGVATEENAKRLLEIE